MSPEERDVPNVDADGGVWIDWGKGWPAPKLTRARSIMYIFVLTVPTGNLFRDATGEEIAENWVGVSKDKVKEVTGLYDLGCFNKLFLHKT